MKQLLEEKYNVLKSYIKNNKSGQYNDEIKSEKISLYTYILAYYSAKIDLNIGEERLKDKILLQRYDKLLVNELYLNRVLDEIININSDSKRGSFADTLDFLKLTKHVDDNVLSKISDDYDKAYLNTVLRKRAKKLDNKTQEKINKIQEKSYKLVNR